MAHFRLHRVGISLALVSFAAAVGQVRIAGYTTNDQQTYGPALQRIAYDPLAGVHVVWKDASSNPFYNYFELLSETWHWPAGVRVLDRQLVLGNLALSPADRRLSVSCSYFSEGRRHSCFAQDTSIGSGGFVFDEYESPDDLASNLMATTVGGTRHFTELRHDSINYHRGGSSTWLGRIGIFPSHNIAASHTSSALSIFWTKNEAPDEGVLYLRRSANNGISWRSAIIPSCSIPDTARNTFLGAYGEFDESGALHVVCNIYDGSNRYSSALWHYCEADTPNWSLVHCFSARCASGDLPGEALIAGRPSIGQDPGTGDLFVVWEQFDTANVETATGILRADIWACRSNNNGRTWGRPVRLTEPDNTSKRYPCIARRVDENLHIAYLIDSIAGFAAQGQGRATQNPTVYHQVPASAIPTAIAESPARLSPADLDLAVAPNVSRILFRIQYSSASSARIRILDCSGRVVRTWQVGPLRNSHSALRTPRCFGTGLMTQANELSAVSISAS